MEQRRTALQRYQDELIMRAYEQQQKGHKRPTRYVQRPRASAPGWEPHFDGPLPTFTSTSYGCLVNPQPGHKKARLSPAKSTAPASDTWGWMGFLESRGQVLAPIPASLSRRVANLKLKEPSKRHNSDGIYPGYIPSCVSCFCAAVD